MLYLFMKNKYYHGSSSASLVGVLNKENPGLKPVQTILDSGDVPYCGELWQGVSKDVNVRNISVVSEAGIEHAIRYANKSQKSWTPEFGREEIDSLRSYIVDRKKVVSDIERNGGEDWLKSYYLENEIFPAEFNVNLHKLRLEKWKDLSSIQKAMVVNPFGVLYGIDYSGQITPSSSQIGLEVGIPECVALEDLAIYVADDKRSFVESLTFGLNEKPNVCCFGDLKDVYSESQKIRDSVNRS
jgi:hypothetical protein